MAIEQWAPTTNRNGTNQRTPALAIPQGAAIVYVQLDVAANQFTDPTQKIAFDSLWSSDGGQTFVAIGGGSWDGGAPPARGERYVESRIPAGATHVAARYTITNGPVRFGVSGEFRDANGVGV